MAAVALRIRERREALQMSQRELARKLGVSSVSVFRWEVGMAYPTADRIPAIADTLACTIDSLYGREGPKVKNA